MKDQNCKLSDKKCTSCQGGIAPLTPEQIKPFLQQLPDGWEVIDNKKLVRTFKFKNFIKALAFVNKVGQIAEEQSHHPDISFTWGKAKIEIWTHKINGLHENDFILAAKISHAFE